MLGSLSFSKTSAYTEMVCLLTEVIHTQSQSLLERFDNNMGDKLIAGRPASNRYQNWAGHAIVFRTDLLVVIHSVAWPYGVSNRVGWPSVGALGLCKKENVISFVIRKNGLICLRNTFACSLEDRRLKGSTHFSRE